MTIRPTFRAVHVLAPCLLALTTLALTACKGSRDDAVVTDTAAGTVPVPSDTASAAASAIDTATPPAAAPATPTASKPAATKSTASTAAAKPAAPAPPPPPKVYPPFDSKASAASIGVHVYPEKGQVIAQQHFEENECFAWAKQNTGIDPHAAPTTAAAPTVQQGGTVRGAARGAAAGAAIGAVAGDAGKGAAIGATAGAIGGRRNQKATEQAAVVDAQAQATATDAQRKKTFTNAFTACMDGRGYAVK